MMRLYNITVISGWPCIGKSTLAEMEAYSDPTPNLRVIDLDSGLFKLNSPVHAGNANDKYLEHIIKVYDAYANQYTARNCDKIQLVLLISSHLGVLSNFRAARPEAKVIVARPLIKDRYLDRLAERYADNPTISNDRALTAMCDNYDKFMEDSKVYTDFNNLEVWDIVTDGKYARSSKYLSDFVKEKLL